ncbi:MAG: hypothetical protein IMW89_22970, partial [Ktedonobacteraceae bacterium]|nr:hypothetical protein [Ktedonobacteraceae bacterium]
AASNSGWSGAIIRGWTSAAQNFNAHRWYMPLYTWWLARKNRWTGYDRELLLFLLKQVAYQHPEKLLALLETDNLPQEQIEEVLEALPRSWSREFSTTILHRLRTYPASISSNTKNTSYADYYAWHELLNRAAIAIPPDCFEAACADWQLPESQRWLASSIPQSIEHFTEQINMRKRLREEIH